MQGFQFMCFSLNYSIRVVLLEKRVNNLEPFPQTRSKTALTSLSANSMWQEKGQDFGVDVQKNLTWDEIGSKSKEGVSVIFLIKFILHQTQLEFQIQYKYRYIQIVRWIILFNEMGYQYNILYLEQFQQQVTQFRVMASKDFNIKETVNKNIEKNQFPAFTNHRSMVGWCSMNYPKTLVNPIYIDKQKSLPEEKKFELNSIFQKKNPIEREKVQFIKPLSNLQHIKVQEKQGTQTPQQVNPKSTKISNMTLATTSHNAKSKIFQQNNKVCQQYSAVLPLSNILGPDNDKNYDRKIRQIGEVTYNPVNQGEQMRHLKKLPNTVIDQQNLMTILNPKLEYLDLQYKTDISNDLINKIGYLAPNIKEINLTGVPITNKVLVELGKSCKYLESINISKCDQIQQFAIISFLKDKKNLKRFYANHCENFTDACLQCLKQNNQLSTLEMNFCSQVTPAGIQFIDGKEFEHLGLSSLPHLKADDFGKLIHSSTNKLLHIDLSFNSVPEINNALMAKLGMCTKLQQIILTGCQKVSDEGINNLMIGQKGKVKQPEGLPNLRVLKLGGLNHVSDQLHQIFKKCPLIEFLEANNLQRLTDGFLDQMKNYPGQRTILINFTPNISDEKIKDVKQNSKNLKVIRNISKMTDPADDGLRMPIPPASLKIKKPKKKKK